MPSGASSGRENLVNGENYEAEGQQPDTCLLLGRTCPLQSTWVVPLHPHKRTHDNTPAAAGRVGCDARMHACGTAAALSAPSPRARPQRPRPRAKMGQKNRASVGTTAGDETEAAAAAAAAAEEEERTLSSADLERWIAARGSTASLLRCPG